jgi:hypothetical protein
MPSTHQFCSPRSRSLSGRAREPPIATGTPMEIILNFRTEDFDIIHTADIQGQESLSGHSFKTCFKLMNISEPNKFAYATASREILNFYAMGLKSQPEPHQEKAAPQHCQTIK